MEGTQLQNGQAELDMQGIFGSILGKALGGVIGKAVGGSRGRSAGSLIGGIGGGLIPFSAGPDMGPQPNDLEMQGFLSVLRKIGQGVGKGVDIGHQLGLFSAGPGQTDAAPPSEERKSVVEG